MKPQPTQKTHLRKSLLCATLLLCSSQMFAQYPTANSYFGLKAAANFATNSFDPDLVDYDVNYKTGFAGGIFYNISISEKFSLQPELLYSQMGSKLVSTVTEGNNATMELDYASIPFLVKFSPIEKLAIFAGPQLNFITRGKVNYESKDDADVLSQLESSDPGGTIGAEYWITKNVAAYARYMIGFSNQNALEPGVQFNDQILTNSINNSGVQVGISIGFPTGESEPAPKATKAKDTDGDGINDKDDKCPNTPGMADHYGCPEMILNYENAEASLDSNDMRNLDKVVTFLNNNPDLHIIIEGHTSALGDEAFNQTLSEKRAKESLEYLVSKGISRNRMKAIGYGEQFLIGDNSVEEGRAKSRRVVIRIDK
jgi:outer membrane protein OmpA-like peptidoglycan-associated protein